MNKNGSLHYFLLCVSKQYFKFSGRASRKEFWNFILFYTLIAQGLGYLDTFSFYVEHLHIKPIQLLSKLALLVPFTAVGVRRFQDTNRTGLIPMLFTVLMHSSIVFRISFLLQTSITNYWLDKFLLSSLHKTSIAAYAIVFFVVGLYYLYAAARDSEPEANKYGLNPKPSHQFSEIDSLGKQIFNNLHVLSVIIEIF